MKIFYEVLVVAVAALIIASIAIWMAGTTHGQNDEQDAVLAPIAYSWWAVHCFAVTPGPASGQTRDDYERCAAVYQWLDDNGVGPFQEAE